MKKLLCVLMVGMVFGEVSQKVIQIQLDNAVTNTNLNELLPDYDLEWALLQIVESSDYSVRLFYDYSSNIEEASLHWFAGSSVTGTYYHNNGSSVFHTNEGTDFIIASSNNNSTHKLLVTAEFPEEDTGYIEEDFDYCIAVGANLVSSPCRDEVSIIDAIPSDIANNLTGIIGQGVAATNQNGTWFGSLEGVGGGSGYWFQSNVDACFNYTCSEN